MGNQLASYFFLDILYNTIHDLKINVFETIENVSLLVVKEIDVSGLFQRL